MSVQLFLSNGYHNKYILFILILRTVSLHKEKLKHFLGNENITMEDFEHFFRQTQNTVYSLLI